MDDYDLCDVLVQIAYGLDPHTRLSRAETFSYAERSWLASFPRAVEATLLALADQFAQAGTEALESADVFDVPAVREPGGLPALALAGDPATIITETKRRLFAA